MLRSDPCYFVVLRHDPQCSGCDPLLHQLSVYYPFLRCSGSAGQCFTRYHDEYIHLYPTFQLTPTLLHCKYKPIHKIDRILLISLQILAKTFARNIIIDLTYNLNKYIQSEMFENSLKWVVYINTLFSSFIARLGRNGKLLKLLGMLITAVHFNDRNWITKTGYYISCKIVFCSEFLDIPDNAGRKTRRRKTQATAKRYAFHANAKRWNILFCL